ncbi:unnamed protein product [Arabidopsis halleri]
MLDLGNVYERVLRFHTLIFLQKIRGTSLIKISNRRFSLKHRFDSIFEVIFFVSFFFFLFFFFVWG